MILSIFRGKMKKRIREKWNEIVRKMKGILKEKV